MLLLCAVPEVRLLHDLHVCTGRYFGAGTVELYDLHGLRVDHVIYSGVPSIVRYVPSDFTRTIRSGHPHYMISGLNSASSRTIHDITRIKHCMGYVQPTRRMTVAQRLCTQQGDRIRCGVSSRMQTPAVVRG